MDGFPDTLPALLSCTPEEYHADPCPRPSLSSSVANTLLAQSPYHAWLKHPRFGAVQADATDEQERGTILHALVLGTEAPVAVLPFDDFRKADAREMRDNARAAGRIPVVGKKYAGLVTLAEAAKEAIAGAGLSLCGTSEQVVAWEEDTARGPILCRGMLDHLILTDDRGIIYDLKTTENAHPDACARSLFKWGYDLQFAAYTSAVSKLRPDMAGRCEWRWLFLEELPYGSPKRVALTVARPDGTVKELGEQKWKRACELWAKCLAENHWPLYAEGAVHLSAPAWAVQEGLLA